MCKKIGFFSGNQFGDSDRTSVGKAYLHGEPEFLDIDSQSRVTHGALLNAFTSTSATCSHHVIDVPSSVHIQKSHLLPVHGLHSSRMLAPASLLSSTDFQYTVG